MAQRIEILRKELYEAVWEKPIRTLAKEWELSDVGLAKVCKKHQIPHPPLRYWAIAGFLAAAEALRLKTIEREEQHRRWEEAAKIRAERERIEREEREFLKSVLDESTHWADANQLRAYADHLRHTADSGNCKLSEQGAAWIESLVRAADSLDPTALRMRRLASD